MDGYKHYIRTNEAGIIIHGFSDAFEQPQDGDILVLENGPRHFHEAWPEPLTNERGQYRFRWVNGQRVERTQQELDDEWVQRPPAPKSRVELLEEENALIALELAQTQARLEQAEQEQAALLLELVNREVI